MIYFCLVGVHGGVASRVWQGGTSLSPAPLAGALSSSARRQSPSLPRLEAGAGGMLAQRFHCKFCFILLPTPGRTSRGCGWLVWPRPGVFSTGFRMTMRRQEGSGLMLRQSSLRAVQTLLPYFSWKKNPCTVTPEPGSKEKLAGYRLQISWRGFKKRHHKMDFREQVVPFVMAGATISCVFSLRPDSLFPPSVFTLTLIMENITGSSFLHMYIFSPQIAPCFFQWGALPCDAHHFSRGCGESGTPLRNPPAPPPSKSWACEAKSLLFKVSTAPPPSSSG